MTVDSVQIRSTGGPSRLQDASTVDYDSFLKLLVATMKNQDPTAPNDPAQTLSQLASFATVEQGLKMNARLDQMLALSEVAQATAVVGRTVRNSEGSVEGVVTGTSRTAEGWIAHVQGGIRIALRDIARIE